MSFTTGESSIIELAKRVHCRGYDVASLLLFGRGATMRHPKGVDMRELHGDGTYELTQPREGIIGSAATYGRVSTEDQADGTSLETQTAECVALAEANGYQVPLDYRIRDEYTGATMQRPGLDRLRQ